jgi:hypothetical protein
MEREFDIDHCGILKFGVRSYWLNLELKSARRKALNNPVQRAEVSHDFLGIIRGCNQSDNRIS